VALLIILLVTLALLPLPGLLFVEVVFTIFGAAGLWFLFVQLQGMAYKLYKRSIILALVISAKVFSFGVG
jgi:hypothetical protein